MMSSANVQILDQAAISARLRRMAYEIYEANYQEPELIVIGIDARGGFLAAELCAYLEKISPVPLTLVSSHLDRDSDNAAIGIELSADIEDLQGKTVVVVDDVLYTGRTLMNVVAILLHAGPRSIQAAVLIDRGHRSMPISPDYVGLELATTLQQHVFFDTGAETGTVMAYLA